MAHYEILQPKCRLNNLRRCAFIEIQLLDCKLVCAAPCKYGKEKNQQGRDGHREASCFRRSAGARELPYTLFISAQTDSANDLQDYGGDGEKNEEEDQYAQCEEHFLNQNKRSCRQGSIA